MKNLKIDGQIFKVDDQVADYVNWLETYVKHKEESLKAMSIATENFISQSSKLAERLDSDMYKIQHVEPEFEHQNKKPHATN